MVSWGWGKPVLNEALIKQWSERIQQSICMPLQSERGVDEKPRLVKRGGVWRVLWRGRYHGNGFTPDDWWLCHLVRMANEGRLNG